MALSKVTYINGTTVIGAENLNAIQDEIIANAGSITSLGTDLTSISGTIAPIETTTTASQKHDVGEFFYLSNVLYEATVAIPVGGTITVGTNCKVANVGAELNSQSDRIDAKADAKGYSENMVAGSADQLLADTGVTEKVPYVYRASDHNSTRLTEKIVGGTIAWNQILPNGNFASTDTWKTGNCTISASNNVLTLTASSGSVAPSVIKDSNAAFAVAANHKYLVMVDVKISGLKSKFPAVQVFGLYINKTDAVANSWITISGIKDSGSNTSARPAVYPWNTAAISFTGEETCEIRNFCLFDLTQMFGSAVADQIYAMETATAGAGVAFFKSLFPKDYYAYNAGELMSVNTSAHVMRGFNAWDEEWEVGYINPNTGVNDNGYNNRIRSKNYIPILANMTYYKYCPAVFWNIYYDSNKNYIGYGNAVQNATFTTPSNACYMRFATETGYGGVYNHDICINISGPAKNGTYEPYDGHTYPLDSSLTLRGVPKLDANNKVYYDGDTYEADGKVTRRYGVKVFDGTETDSEWYSVDVLTGKTRAIFNLTSVAKSGSYLPLVSNKFIYQYLSSPDIGCANINNGYLSVGVPDTVTTKAQATAYMASIGAVFVYELATPTTETADPYQNPQLCSQYGTEEYIDAGESAATPTRDVAVPVGHDTFYHEDLKGKIEGLPWDLSMIAPAENGATASQAYAQGKFFMRNNQFCKAKTSIASGASFTLGTNYEVTTVAAELFSALS